MSLVIYLTGHLVILGVASAFYLLFHKSRAEQELLTFAATVHAPLTPEVRTWLAPQLWRRSVFPMLGLFAGLTVGQSLIAHGWDDLPWFWFATLLTTGAGVSIGALLAGYRTCALGEGPRRTVNPVQRRPSDYYGRSHMVMSRSSMTVGAAAFALAGALWVTTGTDTANRALLGTGLVVILVVAHHRVAAAIVARPMVTSTPEGLLWQKAVAARTVEPMPRLAFLAAAFSAVVAVYASVVDFRAVPLPVLLLSAAVTVLSALSGVAVVLAVRGEKQQATPHPSPAP